jgi:DNA-binding transcriptional LysR family regulator
VLEKSGTRWVLTPTGRQLAAWARDAARQQSRLLSRQSVLRVISTREFAARVLAPGLPAWFTGSEGTMMSLSTSEGGVEAALVSGSADLGFDCVRPQDPSVRFKVVSRESFVVVAAPSLLRRHPLRAPKDLLALPHLLYQRITTTRMLQISEELAQVRLVSNDLATVRAACVAGMGWAVLPTYAVRAELNDGSLRTVDGWSLPEEQFLVLWTRGQKWLDPWVKQAVEWLSTQPLD